MQIVTEINKTHTSLSQQWC